MKKALVFTALFLAYTGFSQELPTGVTYLPATVSDEFCVQLDADQAVAEWYEMEIVHLGFTNQEDAQKAFWTRANNYVSYVVKHSENKVYVHVHIDRTPVAQDVTWWNTYFTSLCAE